MCYVGCNAAEVTQPGNAEGIAISGAESVGDEDAELRRKEFVRREFTIISMMLSQGSSQPEDLPG
jgi:hypothetical protein